LVTRALKGAFSYQNLIETTVADFHELAKTVSDVVKRESDEIQKQTDDINKQVKNG
jgi:hypothetical protein